MNGNEKSLSLSCDLNEVNLYVEQVDGYEYVWSNGASDESIWVSGIGQTYTISVTDDNGCIGEASVTVEECPDCTPCLIRPTITASQTLVCDNTPITLSVTPGGPNFVSYEWYDEEGGVIGAGNTITIIPQEGIYEYTVVGYRNNRSPCESRPIQIKALGLEIRYDKPRGADIPVPNMACVGDVLSLRAVGTRDGDTPCFSSFAWQDGNGNTITPPTTNPRFVDWSMMNIDPVTNINPNTITVTAIGTDQTGQTVQCTDTQTITPGNKIDLQVGIYGQGCPCSPNVLSCMDESTLEFKVSTCNGFNPVQYQYFTSINGGAFQQNMDCTFKSCLQEVRKVQAVAPGAPSYNITGFVTATDANGVTCQSNMVNIQVFQPIITQFQDPNARFPWNVAVGQPITYATTATPDCTDFTWTMPNMVNGEVAWRSLSGGNSPNGNNLIINYSNLHSNGRRRAMNTWFGNTYGEVRLSFNGCDGKNYSIKSTDGPMNTRAQVFFNRDRNIFGELATDANPPAWFVFWRDSPVSVQNIDLCTFSTDATAGAWSLPTGIQLGPLAVINNGPMVSSFGPFVAVHTGSGTHLQAVAETIAHEMHHRDVWQNWSFGFGNPTDGDGDNIPDTEETTPGILGFPGRFDFSSTSPGLSDTYSMQLILPAYVAYGDEELRSRQVEILQPVQTFPANDWSAVLQNPMW